MRFNDGSIGPSSERDFRADMVTDGNWETALGMIGPARLASRVRYPAGAGSRDVGHQPGQHKIPGGCRHPSAANQWRVLDDPMSQLGRMAIKVGHTQGGGTGLSGAAGAEIINTFEDIGRADISTFPARREHIRVAVAPRIGGC